MKRILMVLCLSSSAVLAADLRVQVLDKAGRPLADAVLIVHSNQPGPRPAPRRDYEIRQEQMRFVPAVSVVPLGATVSFSNLDRWDHHVRGGAMGPGGVYLASDAGFQLRLAGRVGDKPPSSASRSFGHVGAQLLGCHLHSSMRGHLYISDSPWAGVTDAQGQVLISALPAGAARLQVWHPDQLLDTPVIEVQLGEGTQGINVPTAIEARRRPAAAYGTSGAY